jgi:glutaredoxin 3
MKVILYTAPACPFCVIVKRFLERNNIKFAEIDISKDKGKEAEMQKKSDQTNVPVVDADGTIIVGYNLQRLKEALKIR